MSTHQAIDTLQPLGPGGDFRDRLRELLAHSWLFKSLEASSADILIDHLQLYQADSGQAVLEEGEISNFMMIIVEGEIDIIKRGDHGEAVSISQAGMGKILGEMSMVDGEPRFATCLALEPTTIAVLSRQALDRILEHHPQLGASLLLQLIALLSHRLRQTSRKLVELQAGIHSR